MNMIRWILSIILLCYCISIEGKPTPEQIKTFEDWWRKENTHPFSKLVLGQDENFHQQKPGVFASSDIENNEILLQIPIDKMITSRLVELSDVGEILYRVTSRWSDGKEYNPAFIEMLTIFLLYEKFYNKESYWKPWLDVLPQPSEMNNILFFKYSELKELIGSPLFKRATDRRHEAKERFEWHMGNIFRSYTHLFPDEPTEDQYKWALSIVRSRSFMYTDNEGIKQPAVVPFFDMFRHVPLTTEMSTDVFSYDEEKELFTIKSNYTFKAGDQIFISLGEKCNSELLDFYGFVLDDNPNDCVHLDIEIAKSDPLWTEKTIMYTSLKLDPGKLKMLRNGITVDLLKALRAATITPLDISNDLILGEFPEDSISIRSDFGVAQYIVHSARKIYQSYTTTEEQEEEILNNPNASLRSRMSATVKKGERAILKQVGGYYYEKAEQLLEQVKKMYPEQEGGAEEPQPRDEL